MGEVDQTFEVSIVVFQEGDGFTAVALDMDLRGYGSTIDEAAEDLDSMILAQISFALQREHPESVWKPADEQYWKMYETARREQLVSQLGGKRPSRKGPKARLHPLPAPPNAPKRWAVAGA